MNDIAIMALLLLSLSSPACAEREMDAVEYAKSIDVAELDSSLSSRPLADWLRAGPAKGSEVRWRSSDCGIKPGRSEPPDGYPVCVDFLFEVPDHVSVWGMLQVGTLRNGLTGKPQFRDALLDTPELNSKGKGRRVTKLSELPALVGGYRKKSPEP
jgi:hypothetical protein